jgi:hypothetical protein
MNGIFYINYVTASGWLYSIIHRLNNTTNQALKSRYLAHSHGTETELGRIALALKVKLSKLYVLVKSINHDIHLLDRELKTAEPKLTYIAAVAPNSASRCAISMVSTVVVKGPNGAFKNYPP